MKRIFLYTLCCLCSICLMAETDEVSQLLADLYLVGGKPQVIEEAGPYGRIQLTDSSTIEIYKDIDSTMVVLTVCAPQCSSCARVYTKEWKLIRTVVPPFQSIFPLASIENGQIIWRDNDEWEY